MFSVSFYVVCLVLLLSACSTPIKDIGRAPTMSVVGSGMRSSVDAKSVPSGQRKFAGVKPLWDRYGGSLFQDLRARRVGDILTIDIVINDKATLGNQSARSKEAKAGSSLEYIASLLGLGTQGNGEYDIKSQSSTVGKGNVDRSENIKFAIAATVVRRLPNGGLLIAGRQEVRVNYELRVLRIQGIVKPQDISKNNRVPYDRIAEARVSYGGRGRIMEVQQPQLGQQLYDIVRPF